MTPDRLIRIEERARDIMELLRLTRLQPDPDTAAQIHDCAQLIHREAALAASELMPAEGNA